MWVNWSFVLILPQDLTLDNADEYAELVKDFCLNKGITKQLEAFKGMTYMYNHSHTRTGWLTQHVSMYTYMYSLGVVVELLAGHALFARGSSPGQHGCHVCMITKNEF